MGAAAGGELVGVGALVHHHDAPPAAGHEQRLVAAQDHRRLFAPQGPAQLRALAAVEGQRRRGPAVVGPLQHVALGEEDQRFTLRGEPGGELQPLRPAAAVDTRRRLGHRQRLERRAGGGRRGELQLHLAPAGVALLDERPHHPGPHPGGGGERGLALGLAQSAQGLERRLLLGGQLLRRFAQRNQCLARGLLLAHPLLEHAPLAQLVEERGVQLGGVAPQRQPGQVRPRGPVHQPHLVAERRLQEGDQVGEQLPRRGEVVRGGAPQEGDPGLVEEGFLVQVADRVAQGEVAFGRVLHAHDHPHPHPLAKGHGHPQAGAGARAQPSGAR